MTKNPVPNPIAITNVSKRPPRNLGTINNMVNNLDHTDCIMLDVSPLVDNVNEHYGDGEAVKSREEYKLEPSKRQGQGRNVF